ncbi:MAG: cob(I)yrinic acid a,c-diamide adenosyltransferase [Bacteroidetes bacterium]|nr:cob(I)yrinic acid a,c-diamide adenosyltransferase [Bacteroidota bacterium]
MNDGFKIYTKKGDKGETSLIGGKRVPKFHDRIEAYGTLDELNCYIGLIRDQDTDMHTREMLIEIQDRLFTAESLLAADNPTSLASLPHLFEDDVTLLENEIDKMNEQLPAIKNFILPGGHITVSHTHVARCICRRAERLTVRLAQHFDVDELIIKYLNRLSDYLFVLARKFTHDFKVTEIPWKARMT